MKDPSTCKIEDRHSFWCTKKLCVRIASFCEKVSPMKLLHCCPLEKVCFLISRRPAGAAANGGAVLVHVQLSVQGEEAGSPTSQVQTAVLQQKWRRVCTCVGSVDK